MRIILRHWFPLLAASLVGILLYQHVQLARANVRLHELIIREASEQVREGDIVSEFAGLDPSGVHKRRTILDFPAGALRMAAFKWPRRVS